ncbi:Protein of unknown function [Anaplasma phagocytophilum]|uniref:Uncharacterized protein n=2 Tax=Anaplasma phagocytophilum TaxID=948 RepID=A0A098EGE2_ANAPH|nr:Protein of unknown function [Anaplasma phagocytophilum]
MKGIVHTHALGILWIGSLMTSKCSTNASNAYIGSSELFNWIYGVNNRLIFSGSCTIMNRVFYVL